MYKPMNRQQIDAMLWALLQTTKESDAIHRFKVKASVCVSNFIEDLHAGEEWDKIERAEMRDLLTTIVKEYEEYKKSLNLAI